MRLIFGILAGLLFLIGVGLLGGAINLIPTDLGLVYLQGGITALTGGIIVLAIGFSTPPRRLRKGRKEPSIPAPIQTQNDAQEPFLPNIARAIVPSAASDTFAPPAQAEQNITLQRDALMAAFERDLGVELEEAITTKPAASSISHIHADNPEQKETHHTADAFDIRTAQNEQQPRTQQAEAPNLFDLPPLTLGSAPLNEEHSAAITATQEAFSPRLNEEQNNEPAAQEPPYLSSSPGEMINARQGNQTNFPADLIAEDEEVNFLEDQSLLSPLSTLNLQPLSELDVVGSYESAGTRFTMYSDGSVVTIGADGEKRFETLDALRLYLSAKGIQ